MSIQLTALQAGKMRFRAQNLQSRNAAGSIESTTRDIFALQAQDVPAGYLSLRARGTGFTASQVDWERQFGDAICWRWSLRGTLHLMTVSDARWLVPLLAPDVMGADQTRLRQLGFTEESASRAVDIIINAIEQRGPLTKAEVAELLAEHQFPSEGQAPIHVLFKAVWQAGVCQGPDHGSKPTYMLFEPRYGKFENRPPNEAIAELMVRYFTAYAPARLEDFAAWSGIKISRIRPVWQEIQDQMQHIEVAGITHWMLYGQTGWLDELSALPSVLRLLPRFDTYLLGYANRDRMIDPVFLPKLFKGGGTIDATIVVDGWIIGLWRLEPRKDHFELTAAPFETFPEDLIPQLEEETLDIARFLEKPVTLKIVPAA